MDINIYSVTADDTDMFAGMIPEDVVYRIGRPGYFSLGAVSKDDDVLGILIFYIGVLTDKTYYAKVYHLFVDEDHRRAGVGTALMEKMHSILDSAKIEESQLLVPEKDAGSAVAKAFFKHLGYTFEGEKTKEYRGEMQELLPGMKLDRYRNHTIEVVIDRLQVQDKDDKRLVQSVAIAMKQGDGEMLVCNMDNNEVRHYSKHLMCPTSGISYHDPAPHDFSFNSPQGACPRCKGLGFVHVIDRNKVIPDPTLSLRDGGFAPLGKAKQAMIFWQVEAVLGEYGCNIDTPLGEVPDEAIDEILEGSPERLRIPASKAKTTNDVYTEFGGLVKYI